MVIKRNNTIMQVLIKFMVCELPEHGGIFISIPADHSASCKVGIWLMSLVTADWWQHSVANHKREDLSVLVFFAFKSLRLVLMNSWPAHSLIPSRVDSLSICFLFPPNVFFLFSPLFSFSSFWLLLGLQSALSWRIDYLVVDCKDLLVAGWLWGREVKRIIVNPIRNEKSMLSTWDSKLHIFCNPL